MTACISRPFRAVYNYVSGLTSRFYNYIAGKVNGVAMRVFAGYLTACKNQVFANEFQSLGQITTALRELQPHLAELETDLKGLSANLIEFPNSFSDTLKKLFPNLDIDPIQRPEILSVLAAQVERAQNTATAAAGALGSLFEGGIPGLPQ